MPFEIKGYAQIETINIKKGASDDSTVSVDIKLSMEDVPSSAAASALGAESSDDIERALFRPVSEDADRNSKFLGLKSIESCASWEGKHAITIKGFRTVRVHKIGKISLLPRAAGKFDISFSVCIQQPPKGYVETLAEYLNDTLEVNLEHDAELDFRQLSRAA